MILAVLISAGIGCPIYNLFGVQCPTCGVTRAWINALCGNLKMAVSFHALFWLVPMPILAFFAYDMLRLNKWKKALLLVGIVSCVLIALYHIARMTIL